MVSSHKPPDWNLKGDKIQSWRARVQPCHEGPPLIQETDRDLTSICNDAIKGQRSMPAVTVMVAYEQWNNETWHMPARIGHGQLASTVYGHINHTVQRQNAPTPPAMNTYFTTKAPELLIGTQWNRKNGKS
jgi:hypothetical protein